MFAQERLDEIMNELNKDGKIIVKELSEKFQVTEDCIRKDLKNLEKKGLIKRTYGGAMLIRNAAHENPIVSRKKLDLDAKKKIAQKVFELIEDMDNIFLDISTTNILLAQLIAESNKKVTIITNMFDIVNVFSKNSNVTVICTGGVFNNELNGFVGSSAIERIKKFKVDKAFIGSCGVNLFDKSITTFQMEDGNTKTAIINAGKKVYLVMESKKFYIDGTYKFAEVYDVDGIIVDEVPDENVVSSLKELDIELI
ncbi:DeoR/GlpR family DNA-binding transcription regulator [Clostridium sediminicola]|uniref:DeoR/GlpR family DNA-binding transcription regulator n=1 Tax=Clostridium sediminicola TaxID=3114879 RepID=UPI0031F23229